MDEGTFVADHLNVFNMIVAELTSVGVKIDDEDRCMLLLCSLPDSWDHLVMTIGSTTTTFTMEGVVASLLSEETRRKSSEMVKDALTVRGKKENKKSESKSEESSKTPGKKSKVSAGIVGRLVISERIAERRTKVRVLLILGPLRMRMEMPSELLWPVRHPSMSRLIMML